MADLSETGRDTVDAEDDSPPTGPRRLLIALYAIFALAATARGIVQIATKFDEAPVAYLLSAGAGVDVVGLRCWDLPRSLLVSAVAAHPREGFKEYFSHAWAEEAARVPQGRARLLRRYGAFTAAIALAPFDE